MNGRVYYLPQLCRVMTAFIHQTMAVHCLIFIHLSVTSSHLRSLGWLVEVLFLPQVGSKCSLMALALVQVVNNHLEASLFQV